MQLGSLVKQKLFKDGEGKDVFRYGILYKVPDLHGYSADGGWGWVFWQLNKDGPYAVSSESYCEPIEFSSIELVAEPR